nr:hypothetical protein [Tanacetum cinerariifolium]
MAANNEGAKLMCGGLRVYNNNPRLLLDEKAEVRCVDDGFQGSWHGGTVIDQKNHIRLIEYDPYDGLTESVPVWKLYNIPNWRGNIRPIPPLLTHNQNSLHYGQCVDVLYDEAWWEGVIFDHDDGSEERLVLFPDIGDELRVHFENTRLTQDWNAYNDEWKVRGDWVFLKVFEELELEWPVLISAKQIWFNVRVKNRFRNDMSEWTCNAKEKWKNIVKEVIFDNFSLNMKIKESFKIQENEESGKKHMLTVGWAKYEDILGLEEVPDKEWCCPMCCCKVCNQNRYENHCGQSTDGKISSCEQCERIHHIGCLERNERLSKFCSQRCEEIFMGLQMLLGKPVSVGKDDLTWTLLKYKKIECGNRDASDIDELMEIHSKLNIVIKVMHECFNPLIEPSF